MKLLRTLINGWLIVVLVDGAVRALAALVWALFGIRGLQGLILPVEMMAVFGGLVAWCAVAVCAQVPKRVVFPPLLALAWMLCGALPFSVVFYDEPAFQAVLSMALIGSVAASELLARTAGHGTWFLKQEPLGERPRLEVRRAAGWILAWVLGAPVAVALYLAIGFSWALSWGTAGFLTVTPDGIAASHKVYTQGDDTVDLIAMIHFGEQEAYRELFAKIPPDDRTLVLAEGVSDSQGLLSAPRDAYDKAATAIGLTVQAPIDQIAPFEVLVADVDVSSFDPVSLELLNVALGMYGAAENTEKALGDYLDFWSKHRNDASTVTEQLFQDILHSRNDHVLAELERQRSERDRLVLPWGALHMVGIEEALLDAGWSWTETHKVTLIRWSTVLGE